MCTCKSPVNRSTLSSRCLTEDSNSLRGSWSARNFFELHAASMTTSLCVGGRDLKFWRVTQRSSTFGRSASSRTKDDPTNPFAPMTVTSTARLLKTQTGGPAQVPLDRLLESLAQAGAALIAQQLLHARGIKSLVQLAVGFRGVPNHRPFVTHQFRDRVRQFLDAHGHAR